MVREVFTLFSQGYGKTAIARMLNERGIPNPTEYKRLQGIRYRQPKGKSSTLWKYFAISNMLTNEIYIGNMVQGKYGSISYKTKQNKPRPKEEWIRTEGTHEPIIEQELWERVQKMLAERAKALSHPEQSDFLRVRRAVRNVATRCVPRKPRGTIICNAPIITFPRRAAGERLFLWSGWSGWFCRNYIRFPMPI